VIAFVTDPDGYKIELIQMNSRTSDHGRQSSASGEKFDPLRNA
jgi:lactoylglutathione lyase